MDTSNADSANDGKDLGNAPIAEYLPRSLVARMEHRRRHRRIDLNTLHGIKRESIRVYMRYDKQEISSEELEDRRKYLRSHTDIAAAVQLEELGLQLARLQQQPLQANGYPAGYVYGAEFGAEVTPDGGFTMIAALEPRRSPEVLAILLRAATLIEARGATAQDRAWARERRLELEQIAREPQPRKRKVQS